jgi:hypothetical protein
MSKFKISIAWAIAVGQLATTSGAQTEAPRTGIQISQPAPALAPVASPAPTEASATTVSSSNASPNETAAPATSSPTALSTVGPAPEVTASPPQIANQQTESLERNWLPPAVNQPHTAGVSTSPRTYEHRFSATLDVANIVWRSGRGIDLFSNNDAAWRIGIGVGYDVLKLPSQLILALEAGAMVEPEHGTSDSSGLLGGTISGTLSTSTFLLGGSLRWALTSWFAPYGRLDFFTSRMAVDVHSTATNATSGTSGGDWSYHRWIEGGALGGGLMFNLLPVSPANVGVLLEGGYWLQHSVDILLESNVPPGGILTSGARLGSLDNSGPYFRLAGVLRF